MNILLPRMEMEYKNEPVECYASILPLVLEFIGISCIRWTERLIALFAKYITHCNSTLSTVKVSKITKIFNLVISHGNKSHVHNLSLGN